MNDKICLVYNVDACSLVTSSWDKNGISNLNRISDESTRKCRSIIYHYFMYNCILLHLKYKFRYPLFFPGYARHQDIFKHFYDVIQQPGIVMKIP